MPGKHPFDLPKYQDTQTRVSSSISGGQHAQAAVQPRYPHDPIEQPTHKQPDLRVINGGKSSQSQGTSNPKSQAIPKSVLKRLPPALLPHPFLWAVVLTVAAGSVLLKDDETDVMTGKPVEETDHDDSVNYLVNEIQNYDPDYTYPHDNDEAGINFLANLLHYVKLEYYNKHHNACRQDFDPNLFAKTVRDLDAREDILNTLYGQTDTGSEADRLLKMEYENYKANGGTLAYDDWVVLDKGSDNFLDVPIEVNPSIVKQESGGSLIYHENFGGHPVSKHVGKTDAQLIDRFLTEPHIPSSSSFTNLETADKAVGEVLIENRENIQSWLAGTDRQLPLSMDLNYSVGKKALNGSTSVQSSTTAFVLLRRDPLMPNGYRIHTAYPE